MSKLIKKCQKGHVVNYSKYDKLKGYEWYNGTENPYYTPPTVLPVFNKDFTPKDYLLYAKQHIQENPDGDLTFLNPIVIKPFSSRLLDKMSSNNKKLSELKDNDGNIIYENITGKKLNDIYEFDYFGGKGWGIRDENGNKKLIAYQLPNDSYIHRFHNGMNDNSIEEEWELRYNNHADEGVTYHKPSVTMESFKASTSPIGPPIAKLFAGLMTLPVAEATGVGEVIAKVAANTGNFFKSPIGRKWLEESLKGMAWGTGSDIVSQAVTGKTLTNHIYDAADKGLLQVLPEKTYSWLSENVPNEVKHVGAGLLNPMYYGPNAFSSMINGVYTGVSNRFHLIGNELGRNVPWIRNLFIADLIHNNIANTNLLVPNNINFGAKYSTTTPYKYNIHGDNKSNIEWLLLTGLLLPKNLSNLTLLEQLGVPKHIRNMTSNKKVDLRKYYTKIERDPSAISNFKKWISNDNVPLDVKGNYEIPIKRDPFSNDLPDEMLQFIKSLPEPDVKYSDNYIRFYRNYLTNADYNHEILSDLDIQKILNASNTLLVKNQSGLMKGKHVFHATNQNLFDHFNWRKTGENTLNMGGQGPGNYFSAHGSAYGTNNFLPYLINNVDKILPGSVKQPYFRYTSTPNELSLIAKKDLKLITSDNPLYNTLQSRRNEIQNAINTTKESNTIYYGRDIPFRYFEAPLLEFALPRNTGIKSLFPHPETFIKNSDGSISLIRDWNDFRLNYKTGGKLISKNK